MVHKETDLPSGHASDDVTLSHCSSPRCVSNNTVRKAQPTKSTTTPTGHRITHLQRYSIGDAGKEVPSNVRNRRRPQERNTKLSPRMHDMLQDNMEPKPDRIHGRTAFVFLLITESRTLACNRQCDPRSRIHLPKNTPDPTDKNIVQERRSNDAVSRIRQELIGVLQEF